MIYKSKIIVMLNLFQHLARGYKTPKQVQGDILIVKPLALVVSVMLNLFQHLARGHKTPKQVQGDIKNIIFIALFFAIVSFANNSYALSEYGAKCDNNPDCVECRDEVDDLEGIECQQCMHACWNMYGPAEFDDIAKRPRTKIEQCRIKWAKWCNAQCWDPDDKTIPDYVSSKPTCNDDFVFPKYNGSNKRPW